MSYFKFKHLDERLHDVKPLPQGKTYIAFILLGLIVNLALPVPGIVALVLRDKGQLNLGLGVAFGVSCVIYILDLILNKLHSKEFGYARLQITWALPYLGLTGALLLQRHLGMLLILMNLGSILIVVFGLVIHKPFSYEQFKHDVRMIAYINEIKAADDDVMKRYCRRIYRVNHMFLGAFILIFGVVFIPVYVSASIANTLCNYVIPIALLTFLGFYNNMHLYSYLKKLLKARNGNEDDEQEKRLGEEGNNTITESSSKK
eukprot:Awhi_evm1s7474